MVRNSFPAFLGAFTHGVGKWYLIFERQRSRMRDGICIHLRECTDSCFGRDSLYSNPRRPGLVSYLFVLKNVYIEFILKQDLLLLPATSKPIKKVSVKRDFYWKQHFPLLCDLKMVK